MTAEEIIKAHARPCTCGKPRPCGGVRPTAIGTGALQLSPSLFR